MFCINHLIIEVANFDPSPYFAGQHVRKIYGVWMKKKMTFVRGFASKPGKLSREEVK
jgi:hypothetical protein